MNRHAINKESDGAAASGRAVSDAECFEPISIGSLAAGEDKVLALKRSISSFTNTQKLISLTVYCLAATAQDYLENLSIYQDYLGYNPEILDNRLDIEKFSKKFLRAEKFLRFLNMEKGVDLNYVPDGIYMPSSEYYQSDGEKKNKEIRDNLIRFANSAPNIRGGKKMAFLAVVKDLLKTNFDLSKVIDINSYRSIDLDTAEFDYTRDPGEHGSGSVMKRLHGSDAKTVEDFIEERRGHKIVHDTMLDVIDDYLEEPAATRIRYEFDEKFAREMGEDYINPIKDRSFEEAERDSLICFLRAIGVLQPKQAKLPPGAIIEYLEDFQDKFYEYFLKFNEFFYEITIPSEIVDIPEDCADCHDIARRHLEYIIESKKKELKRREVTSASRAPTPDSRAELAVKVPSHSPSPKAVTGKVTVPPVQDC